MTIILPIKPNEAFAILNGEKRWIYRRRKPKQKIDKILLYCSKPFSMIIGECDVEEHVREGTIDDLWNQTWREAGEPEFLYFAYFKNKTSAYAFKIESYLAYKPYRSIEQYGLIAAPQTYVYVKK